MSTLPPWPASLRLNPILLAHKQKLLETEGIVGWGGSNLPRGKMRIVPDMCIAKWQGNKWLKKVTFCLDPQRLDHSEI